MKKISLGNGLFAKIDDDDFEKVSKCLWHISKSNYASATIKSKSVFMHRLIMKPPKNMVVDHKDGDRLDNQKSNLRICTQQENVFNQLKHCRTTSSQFKGVHWCNKTEKWLSKIRHKNKLYRLGEFIIEEQAARAYNIASEILRGEFGKPNEISLYKNEMVLTLHNYKKLCEIVGKEVDEKNFKTTFKGIPRKHKKISMDGIYDIEKFKNYKPKYKR